MKRQSSYVIKANCSQCKIGYYAQGQTDKPVDSHHRTVVCREMRKRDQGVGRVWWPICGGGEDIGASVAAVLW